MSERGMPFIFWLSKKLFLRDNICLDEDNKKAGKFFSLLPPRDPTTRYHILIFNNHSILQEFLSLSIRDVMKMISKLLNATFRLLYEYNIGIFIESTEKELEQKDIP